MKKNLVTKKKSPGKEKNVFQYIKKTFSCPRETFLWVKSTILPIEKAIKRKKRKSRDYVDEIFVKICIKEPI